MPIVNLLVFIILAGFVLGLINKFIPMAPMIKSLLNMLGFILVVIYILESFHIIPMILPFPFPSFFHG